MKKVLSLLICAFMLVSMLAIGVSAEEIKYEQPFDAGTLGSKTFRIPAVYTLNDGSVMAAADIRYDHGADSPQNVDIAVAISKDGYTGWEYTVINHFDDYADGVTNSDSASFIDSAIVQSSTGRIFVVSDVCPSGGGYNQALKGTGYVEVNGAKYLLLTTGDNTDNLSSFAYYIGEFVNGYATVYNRADNTATEYTVDEEFDLYKNGQALYMDQKGSEGVEVQQNVFYNDADLCCYRTTYLWMRYSDDNGASWSAPVILSEQVKAEDEKFLGIGPGRGFVTNYNGKERIIFCVYDNDGSENVSTIYSDDNGVTWQRGAETACKLGIGKTSEAQIIQLNDGTLRMYARNKSIYIAYANSTDGGHSWSTFTADEKLEGTFNCMVSFINTSRTIDGRKVVLSSAGGNTAERADGVIRVGLTDGNVVEWISTYRINSGFYAYSCITELADGNFAILYEDQPYHMTYMVFSLSDEGEITEINGDNIEYENSSNFWKKIVQFFKKVYSLFLSYVGLV